MDLNPSPSPTDPKVTVTDSYVDVERYYTSQLELLVAEIRNDLTDRKDAYLRNIVKKMLTYALGRGTEPYDRPAIDTILVRMAKENNSFQSLILAIAESVPFQKRRGDVAKK